MNTILLASEIVRRVHQSPDSVTNLETLVANLIREEIERDAALAEEKYWDDHNQLVAAILNGSHEEASSLLENFHAKGGDA